MEFKKKVYKESKEELEIKIYPSVTLLPPSQQFDGVINGIVDMAVVSTSFVNHFVKAMKIFDLPFLFHDYEQATDFLGSHFGNELSKELEELSQNQIKVLSYLPSSFNLIINNRRPIKELDDLKGLIIRTNKDHINIQAIKSLGAKPAPMDWDRIHTALSKGVVDGLSVPPFYFLEGKIHEVSKYISTLPISYSPGILVVNSNRWEKLGPKKREILTRSIPSFLETVDREIRKQNTTLMHSFGKSVYSIENLMPFKEASKQLFDKAEKYEIPAKWAQTAILLSYATFDLKVRSDPPDAKIRYGRTGIKYREWYDTTNCSIHNLHYAIWEIEVSKQNKTMRKKFDPWKSKDKVIFLILRTKWSLVNYDIISLFKKIRKSLRCYNGFYWSYSFYRELFCQQLYIHLPTDKNSLFANLFHFIYGCHI